MSIPKPHKDITFLAVESHGDTFVVRMFVDGKPNVWVHFIENSDNSICTISADMGWRGSKMQAEEAARICREIYETKTGRKAAS